MKLNKKRTKKSAYALGGIIDPSYKPKLSDQLNPFIDAGAGIYSAYTKMHGAYGDQLGLYKSTSNSAIDEKTRKGIDKIGEQANKAYIKLKDNLSKVLSPAIKAQTMPLENPQLFALPAASYQKPMTAPGQYSFNPFQYDPNLNNTDGPRQFAKGGPLEDAIKKAEKSDYSPEINSPEYLAVINFQRQNGLSPDGIVGPKTKQMYIKRNMTKLETHLSENPDLVTEIAGMYIQANANGGGPRSATAKSIAPKLAKGLPIVSAAINLKQEDPIGVISALAPLAGQIRPSSPASGRAGAIGMGISIADAIWNYVHPESRDAVNDKIKGFIDEYNPLKGLNEKTDKARTEYINSLPLQERMKYMRGMNPVAFAKGGGLDDPTLITDWKTYYATIPEEIKSAHSEAFLKKHLNGIQPKINIMYDPGFRSYVDGTMSEMNLSTPDKFLTELTHIIQGNENPSLQLTARNNQRATQLQPRNITDTPGLLSKGADYDIFYNQSIEDSINNANGTIYSNQAGTEVQVDKNSANSYLDSINARDSFWRSRDMFVPEQIINKAIVDSKEELIDNIQYFTPGTVENDAHGFLEPYLRGKRVPYNYHIELPDTSEYAKGGFFKQLGKVVGDTGMAIGDLGLSAIGMKDVISDKNYKTKAFKGADEYINIAGKIGGIAAGALIGGGVGAGLVTQAQQLGSATVNEDIQNQQAMKDAMLEYNRNFNWGMPQPGVFRTFGFGGEFGGNTINELSNGFRHTNGPTIFDENGIGYNNTTLYNGNKHSNGGIPITTAAEVEGGEVRWDYVDKEGNNKSYIFSDQIKYKPVKLKKK